ncbi:MAG: hypothetical protein LBE80_09690 [Deltaproteobacteria bacterium]|jgi:hypothetical protein|nr:hypothetical protein [Deltaproteobacteria bacterium]
MIKLTLKQKKKYAKNFLFLVLFSLALSLVLKMTLAASPAQAAACGCGTISQIVRSAAETIVSGISTALDASIKQAANYQTQNLHKDLVALREAVLMSQESISQAIETADRQAAKRDIEKTYDSASQPITGCDNDTMGGELMLSKEAQAQTGLEIMDKVVERRSRHDRPIDYLMELSAFPPPEMSPALLGALSSGRTLTLAELKQAERLLEAISDPMPLQKLPENLSQSPAGRIFEAEKNRHEARQNFFQSVLAQKLADRAPTLDNLSHWAESKWSEMGGKGPVPGLTPDGLSYEALFWLLTNTRLASGNWHEEILPKLPEAGLLRELASMMAIDLELSRKRNEHLENISNLLALIGLDNLEAGSGQALRNQYRLALGGDR